MIEYQNADYRSIYASKPFDLAGVGECRLIIFIEDVQEADSNVPDAEKFWTALFLVSPGLAGPAVVKDCLEATVGYKGEPTPTEAAVGLAEFGKRVVLWDRQTGDWGPDLKEAKRQAKWYLENPELRLRPYIEQLGPRKCSACGEPSNANLDARIIHASGIHPPVKYCSHCGQYPASILERSRA